MKPVPRIILFSISAILLLNLNGVTVIHAQPFMGDGIQDTLSTGELGPPPGTYTILSESGRIFIPFEFYRNKFRFRAEVNSRICEMLLDNGSLWDQLLFFGSPKVDSIGFETTGEIAIGNAPADVAGGISLGFGDVVFHEQTAVITRYDPDLPNLWEGFDGQVSATFFKHFVVRIDFDESAIQLIPPGQFTYTGSGRALTMYPGPFDSRTIPVEITMEDGAAVTLDLLIDLGGLQPLYLPIGKDDRIALPPDAVEASLGRGLFDQKGYLGTTYKVTMGDFELNNVPTAFTIVDEDADVYGNSMIGLPLLRRFNIIFDYFNSRIILEPSKSFGDPYISIKQ